MFLKYRKFYLDRLCANRIKFHNRTPDMLAHLKIGFAFLLVFLKSKNQINKSELDKFEKVFDEIVLKAVSANAEIIELENPTTRFCEKLKSLLDSGRCYVETKGLTPRPVRETASACRTMSTTTCSQTQHTPRCESCAPSRASIFLLAKMSYSVSFVKRACCCQGQAATRSRSGITPTQ